jgi:hypothetical protein
MTDVRIVHNEAAGLYRIERRGLFGWSFVTDRSGHDYLTFESYEAAQRYACRYCPDRRDAGRRWKVIDWCRCRCQASN